MSSHWTIVSRVSFSMCNNNSILVFRQCIYYLFTCRMFKWITLVILVFEFLDTCDYFSLYAIDLISMKTRLCRRSFLFELINVSSSTCQAHRKHLHLTCTSIMYTDECAAGHLHMKHPCLFTWDRQSWLACLHCLVFSISRHHIIC
jgi:hypothetical protein